MRKNQPATNYSLSSRRNARACIFLVMSDVENPCWWSYFTKLVLWQKAAGTFSCLHAGGSCFHPSMAATKPHRRNSCFRKKNQKSFLILCFDEFQVTDIADAMILGRLFGKLFWIRHYCRYNVKPSSWWFIPGWLAKRTIFDFTRLLRNEAEIIELVAKEDYRLKHLHTLETTYYFPLNVHAEEFVLRSYNEFTNFAAMQSGVIQVLGRKVELSAIHGDIALTSFDELCAKTFRSADYMEIPGNSAP